MPPTLLVGYVTRGHATAPRLAVMRGDRIESLEVQQERAAVFLGAVRAPTWALADGLEPDDAPEGRDAESVRRLMGVSEATESRARQDLAEALRCAGLDPADYFDEKAKDRSGRRRLDNTTDDLTLLEDGDEGVRHWVPRRTDDVRLAMPGIWAENVLEGIRLQLLDPEPMPEPQAERSYAGRWIVAVVLALVLLGGAIRALTDDPDLPKGIVLEVFNKVTNDRDIVEDTPLTLTTRPIAFCGRHHCLLEGSPEFKTGDRIDRAVCRGSGEAITNGSKKLDGDDENPILDETSVHYGVKLADGKEGWVAAIWVVREQRDLDLRDCGKVLPDLEDN